VRRLLTNFSLDVLERTELQCYLKFSARLRRNVIVYRKLSKQLQLVVEQTRQSFNVDLFIVMLAVVVPLCCFCLYWPRWLKKQIYRSAFLRTTVIDAILSKSMSTNAFYENKVILVTAGPAQ